MEGLTKLAEMFRDGKISGDEIECSGGCFAIANGPRIDWNLIDGMLIISQSLRGAKAQILVPVEFEVMSSLDVLVILELLLL
jgi:hypothetical protein